MELIVRKGNHKSGCTFIELSTSSTTILVDVGQPLGSTCHLASNCTIDADALLVSYPHQHPSGLMNSLHPGTPVFLGELGKNLLDVTHILLGKKRHRNNFQPFKPWQPFIIGDIQITPCLIDSSVADAYAFLVEADGKCVLCCGDFGSHSSIGKFFSALTNHPLPSIDILLLDGTIMRRSNDELLTEAAVAKRIFKIIGQQKNISFVISSSQNISRIISALTACRRTKKTLVIDAYTAWILEKVGEVSEDVPVMDLDEIRVYVDIFQDEKLKANPEFFGDFRQRLQQNRVKWAELTANPSSFVYFGEMSSFRKINAFREGEGPINVIYSQWLGYIDGSHNEFAGAQQISEFRDDSEIHFEYSHTSGHTTLKDLQSLTAIIKPGLVIPINTKFGHTFGRCFDNVITLGDGISFTCSSNSEFEAVENG